jgi:membrane-associated phospholipid phosphatase
LHPHWGENRTFITADGTLPIPAIMPFSTDTVSEYYKMYKAVYDKDPLLTRDEREIAAWWGDDPTETFSPPGHSYYIATLLIKKSEADMIKAAEAYARTGIAVADAFIDCWKVKTTYFNERPSSYVRSYIDPAWVQFWPEPPFPAFPSGHAIQSAAAATVLTDIFGENFSFTDDAHEGHRRYDSPRFLDLTYPARHFDSIWEAANECAYSRFLGGIHTQQDNNVGQQEGRKIGANVNALHWSR